MATRVLDLRMPSERRRPANTTLRQTTSTTAPSAGLSVRVDVSGVSHPGKVRPRNEDHFLVMRIGRYLETLITNLPATEMCCAHGGSRSGHDRRRRHGRARRWRTGEPHGDYRTGEDGSRQTRFGSSGSTRPLPRMRSSARRKGFAISTPNCSTAENRTASCAEWERP